MRVRLLAITPPEGAIDPAIVDAWGDAPLTDLALLVRRPGRTATQTLADPGLAGLLERARNDAIVVLVSCDPGDLAGMRDVVARGLAGVHLRADPDVGQVEAARAAGATIVGASVHGAPPAILPGADYFAFAPVFAPRTPTTGHVKAPSGPSALAAWCSRGVDVLALGGVTAANATSCVAAGASGVASIRSFFGPSAEVADHVRAFRVALRHADAPR